SCPHRQGVRHRAGRRLSRPLRALSSAHPRVLYPCQEASQAGGALVQNVEPSTLLFDSAVATISKVFANLDFYKGEGNIVIVAYDGARKSAADLRQVAGERQAKYKFRYDMSTLLDLQFSPRVDWSKQPLTDDFAPTEYLRAIERHNE